MARESHEGFSPSGILATPRVRDSPIWIQPRGVFRFNPTPGSYMSKNYAIIIQFVLPLTTFYRSGAQKSNVYKRDAFVTSWRFHNRAWQPQRHDRLPETSGTLWIHRGALANQRCSLATGCGIKHEGLKSAGKGVGVLRKIFDEGERLPFSSRSIPLAKESLVENITLTN